MSTVEIIEDDSAMRTLLSEWLAGAGYRVHARAAIGPAATAGVDLVVVNLLNLPAQGAETIRRVKTLYPGAALIGVSTQLSRTPAAGSRQARALGVSRLVSKPCTRGELLEAVAGALGLER